MVVMRKRAISNWSRGRESNPRPTDYESGGRRRAGPQCFCSLPCNCVMYLVLRALIAHDTNVLSRRSRTEGHGVCRGRITQDHTRCDRRALVIVVAVVMEPLMVIGSGAQAEVPVHTRTLKVE